jgi:hypothetical protein
MMLSQLQDPTGLSREESFPRDDKTADALPRHGLKSRIDLVFGA